MSGRVDLFEQLSQLRKQERPLGRNPARHDGGGYVERLEADREIGSDQIARRDRPGPVPSEIDTECVRGEQRLRQGGSRPEVERAERSHSDWKVLRLPAEKLNCKWASGTIPGADEDDLERSQPAR